ncbi:MAG: hypothetical protein LBH14_08115 [Desulfobulbaceae bacterium]|nr:hypothetical protein [Desulfobulbaceae bacterium]
MALAGGLGRRVKLKREEMEGEMATTKRTRFDKIMKYPALAILSTGLLATPAMAGVEWDASGFGTLGAVISDSYARYQRDIDDKGTLLRDSLIGGQVNVKFNEKLSITAQAILAEAPDRDDGIALQLKKALISYRPSHDWLIRVGRMSFGGLLNQENMDVGVSYDMMRLPNEVYMASQLYDFNGLSIAKTWNTTDHEITLDASGGFDHRYYRAYLAGDSEPYFYEANVWGSSLVLTITDYDQKMLRLGWSYSHVDPDSPGLLDSINSYQLANGQYALAPSSYTDTVDFNTLFFGLRFPLGKFMVATELQLISANGADAAPWSLGGYVNLSRKFGPWTPYITYAQMYSDSDSWDKINSVVALPQVGATQIDIDNLKSSIAYFNQQSVMLGTSYAFTPKQKLKGEVMFTHVGDRSAMFDQLISHEIISVYSLAYSFMF